jgi:hypothetical protein
MYKPAVPRKAAQKGPEQCQDCSCLPPTTAKARGPRLWAVHPDPVHRLVLKWHVMASVLDRRQRGPDHGPHDARFTHDDRRGLAEPVANAACCCWRGSPCAGALVGTETGTRLRSDAHPRTVLLLLLLQYVVRR